MSIEDSMRQWSKTIYGIISSLHIAKSGDLSNPTPLQDSILAAEEWNASDIGFTSCVRIRKMKENSITLAGENHEEIFRIISERITKILLVNLDLLTDEWLGQSIAAVAVGTPKKPIYLPGKAVAVGAPKKTIYLPGKIAWVTSKLDKKYAWATNGVLELHAIRNAIVHNSGELNDRVINDLKKAGVEDAKVGHKISISFGDLLRYRRAVRTVINEVKKLKEQ
ncbi:hypothetical protein FACS1894139_01210 [Planctomycetales bacterium]|nr:hypothetical protein FACS1894107_04040 [Planctomycetales bacterium]GHT02641.1 hypothetical protein FACS1894139_01210 [Planctomycetales bacterium]